MINIFDSANKLAADMEQVPEYQAVKEAIAQLKANEDDLKLYREVIAFQQTLQSKQMQGLEVTDEDEKQFSEFNEKMQANENIANLMTKEQAMFQLLQQVQQAMTRPLDALYSELGK